MDVLGASDGAVVRLVLYLLVFWPTAGYYVYRESTRREQSAPLVRALVVGFFGIAGLAAYLYRRDYSNR
ncbi:hypothetical protein [Haladaptatus sp. NG-WS-4]